MSVVIGYVVGSLALALVAGRFVGGAEKLNIAD